MWWHWQFDDDNDDEGDGDDDDNDDDDDDDDDDGDRVRCARGDRGGNEGKRECQHHLHRLGRPHHDCE